MRHNKGQDKIFIPV